MRLGVFSDIHGNIYAFDKLWRKLKKEKCDLYIFLGDICGYYYYQNEVIDIMRGIKNLITVKGNHDEIFLKMMEGNISGVGYTKKYGKSNQILKKTIRKDNLAFLKKLPKKYIIENKIALFHGSPWNYLNEYIYPTDSIYRFKDLPFEYIFLGHTHYPMYKTIGEVKIINPGSVGQPRDFNQPSYAVVDVKLKKVKFKRIVYNTNNLIREIIKNKEENQYLIDVLRRKR